jgi:hypothetical protein
VAADSGATVEIAVRTTGYESVPPNDTVAFVLSPDGTYGPKAAIRVAEFVRRGGTLVVADDGSGTANQLLRTLDASARIDGRPVRDERSNFRSPSLPVAPTVADRPLVAGVDSLTLNYGTVVRPGDATPLVNTSEYAYLDADGNEALDDDETLGPRPVVTTERVGRGRVIVVGDSSVFINAMLDRPGNEQFVRALLSADEQLLLDYSQANALPLLAQAMLAVEQSGLLQFGVGVVILAVVAVWSRRPDVGARVRAIFEARLGTDLTSRRWRSDVRATRTELIEHLERRHPDWNAERVERVVSAIERRRARTESTNEERRHSTREASVAAERDANSRSSYPTRRGRR